MSNLKKKSLTKPAIDPNIPVYPEDIGLTVKGFGSMKDIMNLDWEIDLTKPIYEQVYDENGQLRPASANGPARAA